MRIVAGKHRGLSLEEFDAENIRPTTDRVRENIFNKIQFDVVDSSVLDLFAGTGAVSLEFLSRNARNVISVDNNANSIKVITKNFAKAKEKLQLIKADFKEALKQVKGQKFDFIFLDPPYRLGYGSEALAIISQINILEDDGIIIYEHLVGTEFECPECFEVYDYKKYGTIAVSFIRRKDD